MFTEGKGNHVCPERQVRFLVTLLQRILGCLEYPKFVSHIFMCAMNITVYLNQSQELIDKSRHKIDTKLTLNVVTLIICIILLTIIMRGSRISD